MDLQNGTANIRRTSFFVSSRTCFGVCYFDVRLLFSFVFFCVFGVVVCLQMMQMLAALEEDPALMEEMYAELMKDPAFVEVGGRDPLEAFFCLV